MWGERVGKALNGEAHETFFRNKFKTFIDDGRMELVVGDSLKGLARLPKNEIDVFYVDSDHSYAHVKKELALIKELMKPESIIILNDYIMEDWITRTPYGVVQATNEFMIEHGMEMIYFALASGMSCDVAIRKRGVD